MSYQFPDRFTWQNSPFTPDVTGSPVSVSSVSSVICSKTGLAFYRSILSPGQNDRISTKGVIPFSMNSSCELSFDVNYELLSVLPSDHVDIMAGCTFLDSNYKLVSTSSPFLVRLGTSLTGSVNIKKQEIAPQIAVWARPYIVLRSTGHTTIRIESIGIKSRQSSLPNSISINNNSFSIRDPIKELAVLVAYLADKAKMTIYDGSRYQIVDWLEKNCSGKYNIIPVDDKCFLEFVSEDDETMFRLAFFDKIGGAGAKE